VGSVWNEVSGNHCVLELYPWWQELGAVQNGEVAFADRNLFKTEGTHWRWGGANIEQGLIRMSATSARNLTTIRMCGRDLRGSRSASVCHLFIHFW